MTLDLLAFDLDGVLVDTSPCHARAWADLWEHLSVRGPPYDQIAGRSTRDVIVDVVGGGRDTDRLRAFKQDRARTYLASENVLYPDTLGAVRRLSGCARLLGIATSASRRNAEVVLARAGLRNAFAAIVTGDDVSQGKPSPAVYLRLMEQCGVTPEGTLIVEDSAAGLAAALASGARVATVRTGRLGDGPRFVGAFPDLEGLAGALASGAGVQ